MKQKVLPLPPDILAQKGGLTNITPKRKSLWYSPSSLKKLCQEKRSFDVSCFTGWYVGWGSEQKQLMSIRVNCDPWRWWVAKDYPPWLHYSLLLIVIWKLWSARMVWMVRIWRGTWERKDCWSCGKKRSTNLIAIHEIAMMMKIIQCVCVGWGGDLASP